MTLEVWFHDHGSKPVLWGRFTYDGTTVTASRLSPHFEASVYDPKLRREVTPADGKLFMNALRPAFAHSSTLEVRTLSS